MLRLMILTFIVLIGFASAQADTLWDTQVKLEERLTKVVQSYDTMAYVLVSIEGSDKKINLPSTPFIFRKVNIDSSGRMKLKSVEVTIISSVENFPNSITKTIERETKKYGVMPKIKNVVVPKLESVNLGEGNVSGINSYMDYIFVAGLGLGLLLFAFLILTQRKANEISLDVLREQLGKLGSAFENGGGVTAISASENSNAGNGNASKIELNTTSSSVWETFNIKSIEAIMSDCYWCFEDEYASYIWDKLGIDKRIALLDNGIITNEYATYVCTLDAIDKEYVKDPYYLNPINTYHISNDDLVKLLDDKPGLMRSLSKMRQKNLPIRATQRIKISQEQASEFDISTLDSLKHSNTRVIKSNETFTFASIEEEIEIIAMSENDLDIMEKFPSLAWVLKLDSEEIADLLGVYTAKQLASIWIGPEDILYKLEQKIPKKKAELLKSYLNKVDPSRDMNTYTEIISEAINNLREKEMSVDNVVHLKEAA